MASRSDKHSQSRVLSWMQCEQGIVTCLYRDGLNTKTFSTPPMSRNFVMKLKFSRIGLKMKNSLLRLVLQHIGVTIALTKSASARKPNNAPPACRSHLKHKLSSLSSPGHSPFESPPAVREFRRSKKVP